MGARQGNAKQYSLGALGMAAVASRPRNHSFAVFLGLYLPLLIRLVGSLLRSCLVAKFKIIKLSHRKGILHAWSIKSRRNKK